MTRQNAALAKPASAAATALEDQTGRLGARLAIFRLEHRVPATARLASRPLPLLAEAA